MHGTTNIKFKETIFLYKIFDVILKIGTYSPLQLTTPTPPPYLSPTYQTFFPFNSLPVLMIHKIVKNSDQYLIISPN